MDRSHFDEVEQIYREHAVFLLRFADGCTRCRADAEDILLDTFVLLLMGDLRVPEGVPPRRYLCGVLANRATKLHRWTGVRENADPRDLPRPSREPRPDEIALASDLRRRLLAGIRRLPPRQRLILHLHAIDGLTHLEIADRLGIARNTVKVHLARGRRALRAIL